MRQLLKKIFFLFWAGLLLTGIANAGTGEKNTGDMVFVAAGEFIMGVNASFPDEAPAHKVYLHGFWIDKYEVTNARYAAFLNARGNLYEEEVPWLDLKASGCQIELGDNGYQPKPGSEQQPVVEVTWYGARAYANWRGQRLPTEAEWECAASWGLITGKKRKWPWGNFWDKKRINCWESIPQFLLPVDSLPQGVSSCGAYNMAGNVWEWCADWYARDYYQKSPSKNPHGPVTGKYRIVRGGAWTSYKVFTRTSYRGINLPVYTSFDTGFRCCK